LPKVLRDIYIYIPRSKLPNKAVLTVCLLPGSSAKERFWKLPSSLGFFLTLASICDRSMVIGEKAKSSQTAVKTQLVPSPLIFGHVGRELQAWRRVFTYAFMCTTFMVLQRC